jgi:ribonuclease HI
LTVSETVLVHTDGASRGNPGPASIGVVISDTNGRVLLELGEALPERTTNNVAEYTAVIRALERAEQMGARKVRCLMDSQLVVRQLNGEYKVKHADMIPLYRKVLDLIQRFDDVTFAHVPREMNAEADRLANQALDRPAGERPEALIRNLLEDVIAGDWSNAEKKIGEPFRYRRAGKDPSGNIAALREAWSQPRTGWQVGAARSIGSEILLEATTADGRGLVWIALVDDGKVAALHEYRDDAR